MPQTSANTEYTLCVQDCSGTTLNEIHTPHPIYSDLTGGTVVQLNMVVLGGPNGLNA
jgi:hypothetical protein